MTTAIGQVPHRADITVITNALPCEVTTTEVHGYSTGDFVRLTNLNGVMPAPQHGSTQLDGHKYRIIVTSTTAFTLQNPITFDPIDSTGYETYNSGGYCNLVAQTFYYYGDSTDVPT